MTDRYAVVWTRAKGVPVKMGSLIATGKECRFSYDGEFVERDLPGFSLVAPPKILNLQPLVHKSTERFPLHPRLMAMIPPSIAGNLQRRVYSELLSKRKKPPSPGFETEWEILMLAGKNGIGHLDVFESDTVAGSWYSAKTKRSMVIGGKSGVWKLLKDEIRQTGQMDQEIAHQLADVMGPTPTVGGMTTKLLASVPDKETWDGTLARPGIRQFNKTPFVDAIIKIEQPQYEGIAALENLCLQLHARMGFEVPRRWLIEIEGMRVLAVERFDRDNHGYPLAYESILTVLSGGSRSITRSNDIELKQLAEKIRKLAKIAAIDVKRTLQEIFKRFAVSLMTGNGDMHLDNIGFLGDSTKSRIAPVFDPAPMRAWPRHNLRMAVPIAFENGSPIYEQIARTGMNFGFTKAQAVEELRRAKDMTQDYTKLLMSLAKVPKDRKLNLVEIVNKERELLGLLG